MSELKDILYKCWRCGKEFRFEESLEGFIKTEEGKGYTFLKCPHCGFRIIVKARRLGLKKVNSV